MDHNNIITARLSKDRMAMVDGLYQYDYGQKLILSGVDLPAVYEVHFSNMEHGESKTVIGDENGVDIPDEYLLTGCPVYFWVFLHDGETDGETEYRGCLNVTMRARPTDIAPTPVQQDVITQTIAALNTAVEHVDDIADGIEETIDTALQEAKDSGEFDGYTPVRGTDYWTEADQESIISDLLEDGVYIKPETGIPASDIAPGVIPDISGKLDATLKGAPNGLAELNEDGVIPSAQLPSYVDDVLEFASMSVFPATGEAGKIYVALDTNKTYRWSGSTYVEISESLALGETSSTAYRGDRGAAAYAAAVTDVDSTPTANSGHLVSSGGVKAAMDEKADKTDTVLNTTLSIGRKANSGVGDYSVALGEDVVASGRDSTAQGLGTISTKLSSMVSGTYNVEDIRTYPTVPAWNGGTSYSIGDKVSRSGNIYVCVIANSDMSFISSKWDLFAPVASLGKYAEIVGNGLSNNSRSNARALDWAGNEYLSGDVYVGCDSDSTGGTKLAKVTDIPDISGKVDKVSGATNGNFAGLDANGNLTDSGSKPSDFITEHQDISGKADKTDTVLNTTLSIGRKENTTVGAHSVAMGSNVEASSSNAHAEGYGTIASGLDSHAEGSGGSFYDLNFSEKTSGAKGKSDHSEGYKTLADSGSKNYWWASHSEGYLTIAEAHAAHAEGSKTWARGYAAHSEGEGTIANTGHLHVGGKYNYLDSWQTWPVWEQNTSYSVGDKVKRVVRHPSTGTVVVAGAYSCKTSHTSSTSFVSSYWYDVMADGSSGSFVEIIGNGTEDARSNARALDWNGNEYLSGDIYVGCNTDSTGGTKLAKITDIPSVAEKADKVSSAISGNFAGLDANGNLTDSGSKPSDFITEHQDISGKADKVSGATNGNFAALDANGNLMDSGHKHSDYSTTDTIAQAKVTGVTQAPIGQVLQAIVNVTSTGYKLKNNNVLLITVPQDYNIVPGSYTSIEYYLKVNSTTTKPLTINGSYSAASGRAFSLPGGTYLINYDGTYYNLRTDSICVTKVNNYTPNAAMAKGVDTSISSGSTSTNLPTSAAVESRITSAISGKIDSTEKGVANGVAELDANGLVPTSQLPSYVDDVLEYASTSAFPATGETGKIYVALDTNKTYRWSGSEYVEISASLALGETSSTAYRGDRGATAYSHATDANRLTTAQASGFFKMAVTSEGHVAGVTAVAKSDITALGIPAQDTTYSAFTGADGTSAGASGLVPAPTATDNTKYLKGNGTWSTVDALPSVTSSDNDKVLTVVSGSWAAASVPKELPTVTSSDNGKFLTVVNGAWAATTMQAWQGGSY